MMIELKMMKIAMIMITAKKYKNKKYDVDTTTIIMKSNIMLILSAYFQLSLLWLLPLLLLLFLRGQDQTKVQSLPWFQKELSLGCVGPIKTILRISLMLILPGISDTWSFIYFLIRPRAPAKIGTIVVLMFHHLVTSISRSVYFGSSSVSLGHFAQMEQLCQWINISFPSCLWLRYQVHWH